MPKRRPPKPEFRYEVMYVDEHGPQTWDWAKTLTGARRVAKAISGPKMDKVFIAEWTFKEWYDAA